jgi:hydroxypyruvate reductase
LFLFLHYSLIFVVELTSRELLTHLFHTAIAAVDGRHLVAQWYRSQNQSFSHFIAIGKAAPAMLQGALDCQKNFQQALLICPQGSAPRALRKDPRIAIHEASHPVPDDSSLQAGAALLRFVQNLPADAGLLVLISGGSSSLVEVLPESISLDDLQAINRYLLASGKNIRALNAWRKRFSKIKGGGLLNYLTVNECTQLLISDVHPDDAAVVGSGLLITSNDEPGADVYLQQYSANTAKTKSHNDKTGCNKTGCNKTVCTHIIASQAMALHAVADEVKHMGLACYLHDEFIDGDAVQQGERLGRWLLNEAPLGVHLWGAETTVVLPERPGIGGRNQTFALALASTLLAADLKSDDIGVLAAGSDGIDGNSQCAGAVVFASTARQIVQSGYDIKAELAAANAGGLLMLTGDLFKTGATGTNVMDLIIAWKQA